MIWIICFKKNTMFKALSLSSIPSAILLLDGLMSRSILLVISSLIFAPAHIMISYKNAKLKVNYKCGQNGKMVTTNLKEIATSAIHKT